MEDFSPLDNEVNALVLTFEAVSYLKETAKWARFIAIVGLVFSGLMAFVAIFFGSTMATLTGAGAGQGIFFSVVYLIFAALLVYPFYCLIKFASGTLRALNSNNGELLGESMKFQKSFWKFYGIFIAIILALYAVVFIFGGAMALFS